MKTSLKPIVFHPTAKVTIRTFPELIKKEMGDLLRALQKGETLTMPHSKPMSVVHREKGDRHIIPVPSWEGAGAFHSYYVPVPFFETERCDICASLLQKENSKNPFQGNSKGD